MHYFLPLDEMFDMGQLNARSSWKPPEGWKQKRDEKSAQRGCKKRGLPDVIAKVKHMYVDNFECNYTIMYHRKMSLVHDDSIINFIK